MNEVTLLKLRHSSAHATQDMLMSKISPVVVALKRHTGYGDVYAELVIEDAMRPEWTYKFLRDERTSVVIASNRTEGYEKLSATGLVKEVVHPSWPSWSIVQK